MKVVVTKSNPTDKCEGTHTVPAWGAAPHPRRVYLPLNAGISPLEKRDMLSVPSNDRSRLSLGIFSDTREGPPPDLGQ